MTASARTARTLARVVFSPQATDRQPLYLAPAEPGSAQAQVTGRRSCRVPAGGRASFASYVNAFPASYWQCWTTVETVRLEVEVDAPATVEVFRSDGEGHIRCCRRQQLAVAGSALILLPLHDFDDGGWYWFELVAHDRAVELVAAEWSYSGVDVPQLPAVSIGVTTFDRNQSCSDLLTQLASDQDLVDLVDKVYVVDQGAEPIRHAPAFAAPSAALGQRLELVEQPNWGGSGGFARAQLETLRAGRSDHVLLLDDDVCVDPELLRRLLAFAAHLAGPAIVGAQMLATTRPTELHAMGELVRRRTFTWGPVDPQHRDHDLAETPLTRAPWLHRRVDVDYNGWWCCLIPVRTLSQLGLALPLFIKWDDAEYGLRAAAAGVPTVTLPGVGVWHVPWWDKDDTLDWQAYFHQRNRVIAALLHSPHRGGGTLVPQLMAHQVKHLAAMQYSTAELRRQAVEDVLAGPEVLWESLDRALERVRAIRGHHRDGDPVPVRSPGRSEPDDGGRTAGVPSRARPSRPRLVAGAAGGLLRQLRRSPADPRAERIPYDQAYWWRLMTHDAVVAPTADGSAEVHYRRDRAVFLDLLRTSIEVHRRLRRDWNGLAARYRGALGDLTSDRAWAAWFDTKGSGA